MEIKKFISPVVGICILFASCSNMNADRNYAPEDNFISYVEEISYAKETEEEYTESSVTPILSGDIKQQDLKIIKNATSRFLVNNVDSATQAVIALAKTYGGYVANMKFNQTQYEKANDLTFNVPSIHFEDFISKSNRVAKFVDYNNITSQDVTGEYIDLENRIKVKEEVKKRYEEILRSKTKTVTEVLNTEKQIQLVQEEIEVAKGRMKYINAKSSYSTINMNLYEEVDHVEQPQAYNRTFGSKSKSAFNGGWKVIETIVLILIYLWPLLIIGTITFFLLRRWLRKNKIKK